MMTWSLYSAFVVSSILLIMLPGPNVALIVSNSVAFGARYGLVTVAGTTSAMVVQLAVTVAGLSGFIVVLAGWFEIFRWVGVGYLLYLGISVWRASVGPSGPIDQGANTWRAMFWRGFLISLTNPKTLLFYGAFLPQFVNPSGEPTAQLLLLAATFLGIAGLLDSAWALAGAHACRFLMTDKRWLNRFTGGLLVAAAAGLAMARKS